MGYGQTPQAPDILSALETIETAMDNVSGAVSSGYMQVDLVSNSLSYDGAFYDSSNGYGIADLLYDSNGGYSVAEIMYQAFQDSSYEPFYYSGYSLAYMMYELYSCISGGRLQTSPDNY